MRINTNVMALNDYNTNMKLFKEEGLAEGIKEGMKQGIKQGQKNLKEAQKKFKKEKLEIAKKLLNKKMSVDEIAEITGVSKEEIEKIK